MSGSLTSKLNPTWLSVDAAVRIHDFIVRKFGGLDGVPQMGGLESAMMAPQNHLYYSDSGADLFDLAAVYLYHLARGHAFVDGNKRTGYAIAVIFLDVNGIDLALPGNMLELADATVEATKGFLDKPALAALMRRMPVVQPPDPQ